MNGLDTIIRDNLRWQARHDVAAQQRERETEDQILVLGELSFRDYNVYCTERRIAWDDRANTRGL